MPDVSDPDCAISQALGVVGQGWTLLVVRDLAGGLSRFDELQASLGVPRKTLADRLALLVAEGVVERRAYSHRPPRSSYHLTARGLGLLPVLIALQDWGTRHVLGDGSVTGAAQELETRWVHDLVGSPVPDLHLGDVDPVVGWTVLFCFPGAFAPAVTPDRDSYPPGWSEIPGTSGCTLEAITYRDRAGAFTELGVTVHGVSTQRTDQQQAFADWGDAAVPPAIRHRPAPHWGAPAAHLPGGRRRPAQAGHATGRPGSGRPGSAVPGQRPGRLGGRHAADH